MTGRKRPKWKDVRWRQVSAMHDRLLRFICVGPMDSPTDEHLMRAAAELKQWLDKERA